MTEKKIVLNIPHSSINGIFDDKIGKWPTNPYFINEYVKKWTDWWTDMLFTVDGVTNVTKVIFPYSRFVCDAERLENDVLEKDGQGIIYTKFGNFKRGELDNDAKELLLDAWKLHQQNLSARLEENSVLIDCHSFPSEMSTADICIGFNNDWSFDEKLINDVVAIFKSYNYSVALNEPYSNSITPVTGFPYKSFMIEVNKRVYMDEDLLVLERNPRQWMRWYGCLKKIYKRCKQ